MAKYAVGHSIAYRYYRRGAIDPSLVFVDPRNGKELASNMLRLVLEIRRLYGDRYRFAIAAQPENVSDIRAMLRAYGLEDALICRYRTPKYFKYAFSAKYLLSDVSLSPIFIKQKEQIYLNTWHGTPYKCLGIDSAADAATLDNVQRNLLMSDYLLFPNEYTMEKMSAAYSLNGLYRGRVLLSAYPRNCVFTDPDCEASVRERYGLSGKKVFVYMPTYREQSKEQTKGYESARLKGYLDELDASLNDNEIVYLKLHNLVQEELRELSVGQYRHIRPFPKGIETYEFLSAADVLITDYSSVLFDFASTGKKIVRFTYDEEEYFVNRRVYDLPEPFPFPQVREISGLVEELRSGKDYDDRAFRKCYCSFDSADATASIVRHVFEGKKECRELCIHDDKTEKVLFFAGVPLKNGIIASANNLLRNLNDGRKYYIGYSRRGIEESRYADIRLLPEKDGFYEIDGWPKETLREQFARFVRFKLGIRSARTERILRGFYQREHLRCFPNADFSAYIQFSGYETEVSHILRGSGEKTAIFVHNDMEREIATKKNNNRISLGDAYRAYDSVAVVSRALIEPTRSISGRKDNIRVVHNCQDFGSIQRRGEGAIEFQEESEVRIGSGDSMEAFLDSHSPLFITIGRFSAEKNHPMLIDAFAEFRKEVEKAGLIIIGGYGAEYENTLNHAKGSAASAGITIIRSISNPMPILKRTDLFILSSQYEGMPMVFLEAARLGVPSIATNTVGSKEFMEDFGGYLTENTVEGVLEGMKAFMQGKVGPLRIDFDTYNAACIREFEDLFA